VLRLPGREAVEDVLGKTKGAEETKPLTASHASG
jgi:hypothetical protein